jgi:hypothetical protein
MPANNNPIFTAVPDIQWSPGAVTAANTAKDGTGTVATIFTADAANGGFVTKLVARSLGTNATTVLRLFINNGASNATATNNVLFAEMTVPSTTLIENVALPAFELPLGFALPPGYRLLCTLGTAVAAGLAVSVVGGKY